MATGLQRSLRNIYGGGQQVYSQPPTWNDAEEDKPTLESTGDPVQDAVNQAVRDLS